MRRSLYSNKKVKDPSKKKKAIIKIHEEKSIENNKKKGLIYNTKSIKSLANFKGNEYEMNNKDPNLRKIESKYSLIDYFGDEKADERKLLYLQNPYFHHKHEVNFSSSVYIEMLIYHLLFNTIGPLFNIMYLLFSPWKKRFLIYNLQFFRNSFGFYLQFFQWIGSLLVLRSLIFDPKEVNFGDFSDVFILVFSLIIRSSSIAGKYSTYPKNLIKKVRESKMCLEGIKEEMMLRGWYRQARDIVEDEIDNSVKRCEIDNSIFRLSFITDVNQEVENFMIEAIKISNIGYYDNEIYENRICKQKSIKYYDCKLAFLFLIESFNTKNFRYFKKKYIILGILASLFYSTISGLLRMAYSQKFSGSDILITNVTFYLNIANIAFLTFIMVLTYGVAITDMKRKLFLLRNLGQIISPKKLGIYKIDKLLPTVNLMDQLSLKNWMELRKTVMDYGKKYFFRHEIFLPVILLCASVSLTIAVFMNLTSESTNFSEFENNGKKKLIIFLSINFLLLFYVFFSLLISAAAINKEFDNHISILKKNNVIYSDLLFFKHFYFKRKDKEGGGIEENCGDYIYDIPSLRNKKSSSFIHRKLAKEVKDILGDFSEGFIEEYIKNIIELNQAILQELEDEQRFNSMKILGFCITGRTVTNFVVAFLSLCATGYEILYNN